MSVLLGHSRCLPPRDTYDTWLAIGPTLRRPEAGQELVISGDVIGAAFDRCADEWFQLARTLARNSSARLAHTPVCAPNVSDFGLMLAWTQVVRGLVADQRRTLVICDDPWVHRHLATVPGVTASRGLPILGKELRLRWRGIFARALSAVKLAVATIRCRGDGRRVQRGGPWLLAYGHPASDASGKDAYFGDLMRRTPTLRRVLHVDLPAAKAARFASFGRTISLHAWGNLRVAGGLIGARWRPSSDDLAGPHSWLVRRAAALEGATAQAAMIKWQTECQRAWLDDVRPAVVVWPWENYAWERCLVVEARRRGVRTIGYQHSVIGRQMLNCSPASSPADVDLIPDLLFCNGPATRNQLESWKIPAERLQVAGALRFPAISGPRHDPTGPVFLALPFDDNIAHQMIESARRVATGRFHFLVKEHPMFPKKFTETEQVRRTTIPLLQQEALAAVVYAATTVGLEAILSGIPTVRYVPAGCLALDILPEGIQAQTADAEGLGAALEALPPPPRVDRSSVFASVNDELWRQGLAA